MKKFAAIALLWVSSLGVAAFGQVFTTLYLPTAGSGLTLNIAAGRAFCGGSVVTYAGGTLTMAASVTNRVYLNTASSCAPAVKSTAFTSSDIPVATVVTSGSAITSVADARTMFNQLPSGGIFGTTGYIPKFSSGSSVGNSAIDDGVTAPNTLTSTEMLSIAPSVVGVDNPPYAGRNNATSSAHITASVFLCPNMTSSTVLGCELGVGQDGNSTNALRAEFEYDYDPVIANRRGVLSMSGASSGGIYNKALTWDYLGNVYLPQVINAASLATDINGKIIPGTSSGSFNVNGFPVINPNFNQASPAVDAGYVASKYKVSGSNVINEIPLADTSTFGLVKPDGTSCTTIAGVLTCTGGGGSSPGAPAGTSQVYKTSSIFGGTQEWVFEAGVNSAICDGVTDDTTAFNALLSTVNTAGGGTIKVFGTCLISGQITLPNNGLTNPSQSAIRITGITGSASGSWDIPVAPPVSNGILDLRFNSASGKILTLGLGKLEIDHLTLKDGGSDCAAFIYTTNTTVSIHDNLFTGTAAGTSACNDAMILGGTSATAGNGTNNAFRGYGSYIEHNFFDKIRRGIYGRTDMNAVNVIGNTWSSTCGATTSAAAVQLTTSVAQTAQNYFAGNLYETTNYPYVVWMDGGSTRRNMFVGDSFWDATATTLFIFHFTNGAQFNIAYITIDAGISQAKLSDDNQPSGSNAVMDANWQTGVGLAAIQNRLCNFASGSGTAQVCNTGITFTPGIGSIILLKTTTPNTGAGFTVNANSLGAISVAKYSGGAKTTTLAANDILSGINPMWYDGTNYVLYAPGTGTGGSFTAAGDLSGNNTNQTVVGLKTVPFCTGYTPSNGDVIQYTTASSPNPCYTSTPNGSGAVSSITTTGTSGPATLAGGVLNIPVYTTSGNAGIPFTVIQEAFGSSGNGTSFTLTFPQAAKASGATEYMVVATGGTTVTISGWTSVASSVTSFKLEIFQKTSASDTSATIVPGVTTQISCWFFELNGTRTFDVSSHSSPTPVATGLGYYSLAPPTAITPTAGAWVIAVTAYGTADASFYSPIIPFSDPAWNLRIVGRQAASEKGLLIESSNFTASATTTTPPPPQIWSGTLSNAFNPETILFSIK